MWNRKARRQRDDRRDSEIRAASFADFSTAATDQAPSLPPPLHALQQTPDDHKRSTTSIASGRLAAAYGGKSSPVSTRLSLSALLDKVVERAHDAACRAPLAFAAQACDVSTTSSSSPESHGSSGENCDNYGSSGENCDNYGSSGENCDNYGSSGENCDNCADQRELLSITPDGFVFSTSTVPPVTDSGIQDVDGGWGWTEGGCGFDYGVEDVV